MVSNAMWRVLKISRVSVRVVSFSWNGGRPRKSHTVGILLISMVLPSPMRNERVL